MAKKILVVDDSATMLMSLKATLDMNGFEVSTAADGQIALNLVQTGFRPDLIITDINMPNMDGIELIKHVRPLLRFTPILALTTESQAEKRDQAKQFGATGWLLKPVSGTDLIRVIKQVLPGS
jgi:two-component system chemotaxis response regulator CheY